MSTYQIVGAVAGVIVGYYAGPQAGFATYAVIAGVGTYLDQPNTQGPRLQDRKVQSASYGQQIPIPFGSTRHAGIVTWPKAFKVDEVTNSQSSKGGPSNTTFSYTASFMLMLGQGEIQAVRRVWMNGKLMFDANAFPTTDPAIADMRIYYGTQTQDPDALMVATDGTAPAYRGLHYIMFEHLELTQSGFGNRPPFVEVETFTKATYIPPPSPRVVYLGAVDAIANFKPAIGCVDPRTKWVWAAQPEYLVNTVHVSVVSDVGAAVIGTFANTYATSSFTPIAICAVPTTGEVWVLLIPFPTPDRHAIIAIYNSGQANGAGGAAIAPTFKEFVVIGGSIDPSYMCYDAHTTTVWIAYNFSNIAPVTIAAINPLTRVATYTKATGITIGNPVAMVAGAAGTGAFAYAGYLALAGSLGPSGGGTVNTLIFNTLDLSLQSFSVPHAVSGQCIDYDARRKQFVICNDNSLNYTVIAADTGVVTSRALSLATGADTTPTPSSGITTVVYYPYADNWIFGAQVGAAGSGTTLYLVTGGAFRVIKTYTYEADLPYPQKLISPLLIPKTNLPYVLSFDQGNVKRLYIGGGIAGGAVTLASIVKTLCTMAPFGLADTDIDVTQLETTFVDGYLIGQQMTRREAIEQLSKAYYFDAVESDHKIKFIKRGGAPVVTIPLDDRAAYEDGSEVPSHLDMQRGAELELPWAYEVKFVNAAADYQTGTQYARRITRNANDPVTIDLAITMTPAKSVEVAAVNLYAAWLRESFSFTTGLAYAKYEPTDIVTLPAGDVTYNMRLTARSDLGNGIIKWQGALEDANVYTQTGTVSPTDFVPQTISDPGETNLLLMDTAMLRDADDNAGFYVGMGGTTVGWPGAQLFRSGDSGLTYDLLFASTTETVIGTAISLLGNFTAGNIFDEGNSVTVLLNNNGALLSATETQVLNGANAAIFGAPGRWEILQFKNANLIAAETYQLSGFLRGRRGTEWATGTHVIGDTFALATLTTINRPNAGTADLGLSRLYKAPPFRTVLSAAQASTFINTGLGLKPYAPVSLRGTRDGSNNLTITWQRRSRIGYGTLNVMTPLGEATESYSVDILSGATVLRTIASATQTATYSAANQTTDGLTPGNAITMNVYQLSATVGRGYALNGTV